MLSVLISMVPLFLMVLLASLLTSLFLFLMFLLAVLVVVAVALTFSLFLGLLAVAVVAVAFVDTCAFRNHKGWSVTHIQGQLVLQQCDPTHPQSLSTTCVCQHQLRISVSSQAAAQKHVAQKTTSGTLI